ncbi:hypothetical protein HR15_02605 [Porphyromonas gulae]|uniref:Uncharacterized protein n=1 Tax=Porphyromonas gulae TaxID=111105 RepID=A0A0A2FKF8_9PORP|nr:hypothetical protein HR15_02605 [Porphyromonas gulae]
MARKRFAGQLSFFRSGFSLWSESCYLRYLSRVRTFIICGAFLFCGCALYLSFSGCFCILFLFGADIPLSMRIRLFGSLAWEEPFGLWMSVDAIEY